jgi:hypothetical protein
VQVAVEHCDVRIGETRAELDLRKRQFVAFRFIGFDAEHIVLRPLDGAIDIRKQALGSDRVDDSSPGNARSELAVRGERKREVLVPACERKLNSRCICIPVASTSVTRRRSRMTVRVPDELARSISSLSVSALPKKSTP